VYWWCICAVGFDLHYIIKEKQLLEDFGNCVGINGQKIPAMNIQVENMPGYIYHEGWGAQWYGVYFEVMFEPGYLWVVSMGALDDPPNKIVVKIYQDWSARQKSWRNEEPDITINAANWDDFLEMYNAKDEYWAAIVLPVHFDATLDRRRRSNSLCT
jgi:hypothetical protein